ncbi:unnamed protein product [Ceratitis capitata]|uniref:(Mediterranean fruit fly) hypothetical protein n=1 Tax=Ceratitis capitata TaxID=7213 RepID=A0A811V2C3_CERCA|nr:unnamed protein product [Ceratitis capitata]
MMIILVCESNLQHIQRSWLMDSHVCMYMYMLVYMHLLRISQIHSYIYIYKEDVRHAHTSTTSSALLVANTDTGRRIISFRELSLCEVFKCRHYYFRVLLPPPSSATPQPSRCHQQIMLEFNKYSINAFDKYK